MMTNKELQDLLKQYPDDMPVCVFSDRFEEYNNVYFVVTEFMYGRKFLLIQ